MRFGCATAVFRDLAAAPCSAGVLYLENAAPRRACLFSRHTYPAHRALEVDDRRVAALGAEGLFQPVNGARVQLRDAGLVDADLGPNLLHRRFAVVVETDHFAFAGRQRRDGAADPVPHFPRFVGTVGRNRLRRHERRRQRCAVDVLAGRQRRRAFDRVDPDDRLAQAGFVGPQPRGKIRERRFGAKFPAQLLARGLELPALPPDPARPGVAAEGIDHRAPHASLGERLELDAARVVIPAGRIDQADHAVLHEIAQLDRVRHRRGDAASERFDERKSRGNAVTLTGCDWLTLHDLLSSARRRAAARTLQGNGGTRAEAK